MVIFSPYAGISGDLGNKKALSSQIRDERTTNFRGTTQIRRTRRTRFPLTEDDPSAHFLAAAPGRTQRCDPGSTFSR